VARANRCCWWWWYQEQDIAQLPADIKARLLASARASGDDDKQCRAEASLGDPAACPS
jgi:hypothetical protein